MKLVLDVETKVTRTVDEAGKTRIDNSPFNPENYLVSVGFSFEQPEYFFLKHNDVDACGAEHAKSVVQQALDNCTLLIGHNIKYDLMWLRESGFTYEGPLFDTMVAEYVLARGQKVPLSLEASCLRRGVQAKKKELIDEYWKNGVGFEAMPMPVVDEYGRGDVESTAQLYAEQVKLLQSDENKHLLPTIQMSMDFLEVLIDLELAGIKIDLAALDKVEQEYKDEQATLKRRLQEIVSQVMGDTPINLASPEQLSQVIYSRRVRDKHVWEKTFNLGLNARGKPKRRPKMGSGEFSATIRSHTDKLRKTLAEHCQVCAGEGKVRKTRKDGTAYKKANNCPACGGRRFNYVDQPGYAGFKLSPAGVGDVAAGGFATDKDTLKTLVVRARLEKNTLAEEFLEGIIRLNAIDTYLASFVGGIRRGLRSNAILHPGFNQTVTSTGRLSSSNPNFQNQPRGKTFPIRRVVISRWEGGEVLEGDYSQLEFRCAGLLSGDHNIREHVLQGVDCHAYTSSVLTEAGQPTDRQDAKPHTFKPLYGGTSGTDAERKYYDNFIRVRYPRVGEWHKELLNEAVKSHMVRLPTGREFHFPNAIRNFYGGVNGATQIKNWPVQGFATADIVPISAIRLRRLMRHHRVRSVLFLTVHDSLEVDVYPGEKELMVSLMREAMLGDIEQELAERYDMKVPLFIPLDIEMKSGPNWLDTTTIKEPTRLAA